MMCPRSLLHAGTVALVLLTSAGFEVDHEKAIVDAPTKSELRAGYVEDATDGSGTSPLVEVVHATAISGIAEDVRPRAPNPRCAVPSFDAEWRGRSDAERWVPGLYPSDPPPPGTLVLTFDDGPRRETEAILDLLAEHDMSATFFVVGRVIDEDNFGLVQRMIAEGHTVANHTWDHDTRMTLSEDATAVRAHVSAEYELTQMIVDVAVLADGPQTFRELHDRLFEATGRPDRNELAEAIPRLRIAHEEILAEHNPVVGASPYPMVLSRPPGGSPYYGRSIPSAGRAGFARALDDRGLLNVMWTHDTHDSDSDMSPAERADPDRLRDVFVEAGQEGAVLLAHDRINLEGLSAGLAAVGADPTIDVVSIEELLAARFACRSPLLGVYLGHAPAEVFLAAIGSGPSNQLAELRVSAGEELLVGSAVEHASHRTAESLRVAAGRALLHPHLSLEALLAELEVARRELSLTQSRELQARAQTSDALFLLGQTQDQLDRLRGERESRGIESEHFDTTTWACTPGP